MTRRAPPTPPPAPPRPTCPAKPSNERAAAARGPGLRGRPRAAPANREASRPRGLRPPSLIGRLAPAARRAVNQRTRRPPLNPCAPAAGEGQRAEPRAGLGSWPGRGSSEGQRAWGQRVQLGEGPGGVLLRCLGRSLGICSHAPEWLVAGGGGWDLVGGRNLTPVLRCEL